MLEDSSKGKRTRNWTFVCYPDSAPENWQFIISQEHIQWACSPLHDADLNGDGSEKKPHWHVFLSYDGVKTYEQILPICEAVNGTIPLRVQSAKGLIRYFAHLDNPDKHQYSIADIQTFNGFDVETYLLPTKTEREAIEKEMCRYIYDNCVTELSDFIMYCACQNPDWYSVISSHTYLFNQLINSMRHSCHKRKGKVVNPETGEIIEE